jgi:hypothetical protein
VKTWVVVGLGALALVLLVLFAPVLTQAQTSSVTLDWTAPGDDGSVGTATTYEMRWSTVRPDTTSQATIQTWWSGATVVAGLPNPQIAGTTQTVTVSRTWLPGTYYFVMRAADEVPNWSLFSNVAVKVISDTQPPGRIIDLLVR